MEDYRKYIEDLYQAHFADSHFESQSELVADFPFKGGVTYKDRKIVLSCRRCNCCARCKYTQIGARRESSRDLPCQNRTRGFKRRVASSQLQTQQAFYNQSTNVAAHGCTSDRLNAQNADVEIWYPWHPWYRRVVHLIRAVKRNGTSSYDVKAVYDDRIQVLSIPSWMCDRAACAAVRLDIVPKVNVESLRILRELLQAAVPRRMPDMVEDRHTKGPSLGDAYANSPTNASPSAGVIPSGGIAAHLAESPGSSKASNKKPLRTANRGVAAASKSANPKEGGCQ